MNEAKFYRRYAAKLNYMALDRPDLYVAANMLSQSRVTRSSSNASVDTCENTQHVSFNTHVELLLVPWLCAQTAIGPVAGRRGAVRVAWQCSLGEDLLYFASRFQKSVALTSGEAELGAQVAGVAGGLSLQTLFAEFGLRSGLHSLCHSSAARGIMNRSGTDTKSAEEPARDHEQNVVERTESTEHTSYHTRFPFSPSQLTKHKKETLPETSNESHEIMNNMWFFHFKLLCDVGLACSNYPQLQTCC